MIKFIKNKLAQFINPKEQIYNNINQYYEHNKYVYDDNLLNIYRFEKFIQNFDEIKLGKQIQQKKFKHYVTSVKKMINKDIRILDIGGGYGDNYFYYLKYNSDFYYSVLETKGLIKFSNKLPKNNIYFYSNIDEAIKEFSPNIIFSSGTIHYLENPYKFLKTLSSLDFLSLLFIRNNFSKKYFGVKRQTSYLSQNGYGKHIDTFHDQKIFYPSHFLKKELFKSTFQKNYDIFFKNISLLDNKFNIYDLDVYILNKSLIIDNFDQIFTI